MQAGPRLAAAARGLVGCPFRMHGRNPATGLDCVGVAAAALAQIGREAPVPRDYRLRGGSLARFDSWAFACGLEPMDVFVAAAPGDILLCEAAPQQFHVIVDGDDVLVHAHVGLGRVVAWPLPAPWPVRRRWRLLEG